MPATIWAERSPWSVSGCVWGRQSWAALIEQAHRGTSHQSCIRIVISLAQDSASGGDCRLARFAPWRNGSLVPLRQSPRNDFFFGFSPPSGTHGWLQSGQNLSSRPPRRRR